MELDIPSFFIGAGIALILSGIVMAIYLI